MEVAPCQPRGLMVERDPNSFGNILGVWAHPDDEAYLTAGVMHAAVAAGRRVVCVTATKGEAGFPDDDPRSAEARAAIREEELAASLSVLGVTEHRWLGYRDGHCHEVDVEEAVGVLAQIIDEVRPEAILTFGPDGGTGHVDHIAVSRWTTLAWRHRAPSARLLYSAKTPAWLEMFTRVVDPSLVLMTDELPPSTELHDLAVWIELEGAALDRKITALHCQPSQIAGFAALLGDENFRVMNKDEFFRAPTEDDWPAST